MCVRVRVCLPVAVRACLCEEFHSPPLFTLFIILSRTYSGTCIYSRARTHPHVVLYIPPYLIENHQQIKNKPNIVFISGGSKQRVTKLHRETNYERGQVYMQVGFCVAIVQNAQKAC